MKAVQSTLFVSILTLLLGVSVPAQAAPSLQPDTLSDRDLELLFEQDGKPMQLALLSDLAALRQFLMFGGGRWVDVIRSLRVKVHYDRKPHDFKQRWLGPLRGNRPHLQITIWHKGVKGSDRHLRVPTGPTQPKGGNPG